MIPEYITDTEVFDAAEAACETLNKFGLSLPSALCIVLAEAVISAQCAAAEAQMEAQRAGA